MYKKMDLINEESTRWMGNNEREFDNSERERTRTMDIISLKIGGRITD